MVLDKNNKQIQIGDKVRNNDNNKEFIFTSIFEIALNPFGFNKEIKMNNLEIIK